VLIEKSQGFKNFLSLIKDSVTKTISNFLLILEELFEEIEISSCYFAFIQFLRKHFLLRKYFSKVFKSFIIKNVLENEYQNIIKFYSCFQIILFLSPCYTKLRNKGFSESIYSNSSIVYGDYIKFF
jgi:hypothetical protein